jgi:hypothetical protein
MPTPDAGKYDDPQPIKTLALPAEQVNAGMDYFKMPAMKVLQDEMGRLERSSKQHILREFRRIHDVVGSLGVKVLTEQEYQFYMDAIRAQREEVL